jgi:hypothetical protein
LGRKNLKESRAEWTRLIDIAVKYERAAFTSERRPATKTSKEPPSKLDVNPKLDGRKTLHFFPVAQRQNKFSLQGTASQGRRQRNMRRQTKETTEAAKKLRRPIASCAQQPQQRHCLYRRHATGPLRPLRMKDKGEGEARGSCSLTEGAWFVSFPFSVLEVVCAPDALPKADGRNYDAGTTRCALQASCCQGLVIGCRACRFGF